MELTWIKGAGEMATGVAYRLLQAGFPVLLTELPQPLVVRRSVSFADAVTEGRWTVEQYTAVRVSTPSEVIVALAAGLVPAAVDPEGALPRSLHPGALIDAVLAKRNTGTSLTDAPTVIALGPGFTAGVDCHAVIETNRGHYLGRALYEGSAAPDTGVPGVVEGVAMERVLRAPAAGLFHGLAEIGAVVRAGDRLAEVVAPSGERHPVITPIAGVMRGLMRSGTPVPAGIKVGDVDPSGEPERCHTISDKALAIGGGALEALLRLQQTRRG